MKKLKVSKLQVIIDQLAEERTIELTEKNVPIEFAKPLNSNKEATTIVDQKESEKKYNLNQDEQPLLMQNTDFEIEHAEVSHNLVKWKNLRLEELALEIYPKRPEINKVPNIPFIYIDKTPLNKQLFGEEYFTDELKSAVLKIYETLIESERKIYDFFSHITSLLPNKIIFITNEELIAKYPNLSPKGRENVTAKKYGAIFIIGKKDTSTTSQKQLKAPLDSNNSSNTTTATPNKLKGDIIIWNPSLNESFELLTDIDIPSILDNKN